MTAPTELAATSREPNVDPVARPFLLPQFGIFAQGTHAHHFLELDLNCGVSAADAVRAFRALGTPDVAAGGVNVVVAFGAKTWRSVAPGATPADLTPVRPVTGRDGRTAPATQHDVWLWISGAEPDVTWRSARGAVEAVGGAVHVAAEQTAFTYHGGRDITGSWAARRTRRRVGPPRSRSSRSESPARAAAMCSRCDGCTISPR